MEGSETTYHRPSVTVSNDRGMAVVVEQSDEGIEITVEHAESGEGTGIVLTRDQAQQVRHALDKIDHAISVS